MAKGGECAVEACMVAWLFNNGKSDGMSSFKGSDILVSFPTEVSTI